MRRFHLIGVSPDLSRTLAIQTSAGWLLPWMDDNPRVGLPAQVHAILSPMVSTLYILHEAPLQDARSTNQILQGYCAVLASGTILSKHVQFVANIDLLVMPSVLSLQREGWLLALQRLRAPVADFDCRARVAAALAWAECQVRSHTGADVLSMARHRCSRHEYVVRLETTKGRMYFKGGRERVADEGVLTHQVHGLHPSVVPETVALDLAAGRWIYRELPGSTLVGSTLTMSTALSVVPVLVELQKRAAQSSAVRQHLSTRCLSAVDLIELTDRIVRSEQINEGWPSSLYTLVERCLAIDGLNLPSGLVLSDLWAHNILITPTGVGFIDLERSYWTLPFLSLWRFIQDVEGALQTGGVARTRIEAAFVSAWADVVNPRDMTTALNELPLLGRLFDLLLASRELDLRERDLGSPLPTGARATVLSRHVRRLLESALDARP